MQIEQLAGKAREAARLSTARVNVYEGAVRSGKTIASLLAWLQFVRTGPSGPLLMVGKTERTLRRNILDQLVEMLGPTRCRLNAGTGDLWLLGRRVYITGANDERAQERIRGLTLAGAYVDEATTIPESFWAMLLTRLSVPGARLLATTNPDSSVHWLKVNYLDRAALFLTRSGDVWGGPADALDLHRFAFQLTDNPTLPAEYIQALEAELRGVWRRRLILGEWCIAEGAIYDMFVDHAHVVDQLPSMRELWWVGVDYGTANPFAALLLGTGDDQRLHVADEWRWDSVRAMRQKTDLEYSAALRRRCGCGCSPPAQGSSRSASRSPPGGSPSTRAPPRSRPSSAATASPA